MLLLIANATCLSISGSAIGQLPSWPDPVANHIIPMQSTDITHGPVLGNVSASSVRIWLRANRPTKFEVLLAVDRPPFENALSFQGETVPTEDHTGVIEATGLKANTRYAYAIRVDGELVDIRSNFRDPWPTFRTLPDKSSFGGEFNPEGKFNFAFSIGACQRQRSPGENFGIYENPPAFDTLWLEHRDETRFHIINGDYTYEETLDGQRAGIEDNYKLYLDRGRSLNRFLRYTPMLTMFNDHEATDNIDGAGEVGLGDGNYLVRDPALRVWQYYADWANGNRLHNAPIRFGQATFTEGSNLLVDRLADFSSLDVSTVSTLHVGPFMKGSPKPPKKDRGGSNVGVYRILEVVDKTTLRLDRPAKTSTQQTPYSIGVHHYFEKTVGNCQFLFLDTRSERSRWLGTAHSHDDDRHVLGDSQKSWLLDRLRDSQSDFVFIVSPDPWFIYHSAYHVRGNSTESKGDGYCGYVVEREELVQEFDRLQKPVILLTGDVHQPVAAQITDNVWEFLISPVNSANHPIGTAGLPPLGGWFDSEGRKIKIKWLGGYPDNVHYLRQRHTVYAVVSVNNIIYAPRKEGAGYQFLAYDEPQAVIRFHDGYTGKLLYSEGISTIDAKPPGPAAAKENRFGHWNEN